MNSLYLIRFNKDSSLKELHQELSDLEAGIIANRKKVLENYDKLAYSQVIRLHNIIAGMIAKKSYVKRMIYIKSGK